MRNKLSFRNSLKKEKNSGLPYIMFIVVGYYVDAKGNNASTSTQNLVYLLMHNKYQQFSKSICISGL